MRHYTPSNWTVLVKPKFWKQRHCIRMRRMPEFTGRAGTHQQCTTRPVCRWALICAAAAPTESKEILNDSPVAPIRMLASFGNRALNRPGSWCMSTSRSSARYPTAAAGRCSAAAAGGRKSQVHPVPQTEHSNNPIIGYHYLRTALDDHFHLTYCQVVSGNTGEAAAAFWRRPGPGSPTAASPSNAEQ